MTLTHWKKLHNPNYFGAWSIPKDGTVEATIVKVGNELVVGTDGKKEECVVAHLDGQKPLILNSTNSKSITASLGTPYIEEWVGKKITLYTAHGIKAFGDVVDAVRVRVTQSLPILSEDDPAFAKAVQYYVSYGKLDGVRKKYTITPETEKIIINKATI